MDLHRPALRLEGLAAVICLAAMTACGGGGASSAPERIVPSDIGARMSASSVLVERDLHERNGSTVKVLSLIVSAPPAEVYYYRESHTDRAILFVGASPSANAAGLDFQIGFSSPGVLPRGIYEDTLTLEVCIDSRCEQPVKGSPFVVPVRLEVGFFAPSDPELPALPTLSRVTLAHDLVDAVYSSSLDALVSVSSRPIPAINVHDLSTGLTRSQPLLTSPTSLSLEPGGTRVVVGHDAAVSVVDLALPGAPAPITVRRYPLAIAVGQVVFDGRNRVHAFSGSPLNFAPMHTLSLDTGTVTETGTSVFNTGISGRVLAALHPSGNRLYVASRDTFPNDIFGGGLSDAAPLPLQDSPYHGEHEFCGAVWPSANGTRLHTGCGVMLTSTPDVNLDMRYAGVLPLRAPGSASGRYVVVSVSDAAANDEVAQLEQPSAYCDPRLDNLIQCFTTYSVYSSTTLAPITRHSLPPVTVGPNRFAQIGRFVFRRSTGQRLLVSELRDAPDPTASILLSRLP